MFTFARVALDGARSLVRGAFFTDENAQDVFEYVLIIGIITVAVLVAVATPFGGNISAAIVNGTCNAINDASDAANGLTAPGTKGDGILGTTC